MDEELDATELPDKKANWQKALCWTILLCGVVGALFYQGIIYYRDSANKSACIINLNSFDKSIHGYL